MERVSVTQGELPVLLISPHSQEEENTGFLVERIAQEMNLFSVVNNGWKCSKQVDYKNELANCNNINHINQDVIREEFLEPILRSVAKIQKNIDERVFVLHIHGCSDEVRNKAKDDGLDLIVGYGEGKYPSYSCDLKIKNHFLNFLEQNSFGVYEGKKSYRGHNRNNLNQLFRHWYPKRNVHSMQIHIVEELRSDSELLEITIEGIISAIDELILLDDTSNRIINNFRNI